MQLRVEAARACAGGLGAQAVAQRVDAAAHVALAEELAQPARVGAAVGFAASVTSAA